MPDWWYAHTASGPKHHLSPTTFDKLKSKFTETTDGGCSMSKDELKKTLSEKIIKDREKSTGDKYKHDLVPESTLRHYVNEVISLYDFNMFNSVSNKTESRSVTEFSIRSTVSFLLVVLTNHFVRGIPTLFHKPKKEMEKSKVWKSVNRLNKKNLGISESMNIAEQFIHVLPHLITSTDECSIFITTQIINKKIAWHFSLRPSKDNCPTEDSSKRDVFTNHLNGDAHLRGVRISVNNTFTVGGCSAPIFTCIYGLTMAKMPRDKIVICEIPGLVLASNQNGSTKIGFIVFVRGSDNTNEPLYDDTSNNDEDIDETYYSKDVKVAKIYRERVFYPLIEEIRKKTTI